MGFYQKQFCTNNYFFEYEQNILHFTSINDYNKIIYFT